MSDDSKEPDNGKWATACLRLASDSLRAETMAAMLDCTPSRSHEAGEPVTRRTSNAPLHKEAVCIFDCPLADTVDMEEQLAWVAALAERNAGAVRDVAAKGCVEIWLGFAADNGQGGFVMSHALLKRISGLPIDVVLDLYPPEGPDGEEGE